MAGKKPQPAMATSQEDQVAFDYIKGKDFRSIRADGAVGGVTPSGYIHFALYSERGAIPRRVVNKINADGSLGEEIEEEGITRGSIVREMDVDVFLRPTVARNLHRWLGEQIDRVEAMNALSGGEGDE